MPVILTLYPSRKRDHGSLANTMNRRSFSIGLHSYVKIYWIYNTPKQHRVAIFGLRLDRMEWFFTMGIGLMGVTQQKNCQYLGHVSAPIVQTNVQCFILDSDRTRCRLSLVSPDNARWASGYVFPVSPSPVSTITEHRK